MKSGRNSRAAASRQPTIPGLGPGGPQGTYGFIKAQTPLSTDASSLAPTAELQHPGPAAKDTAPSQASLSQQQYASAANAVPLGTGHSWAASHRSASPAPTTAMQTAEQLTAYMDVVALDAANRRWTDVDEVARLAAESLSAMTPIERGRQQGSSVAY